MIFLLDQVVQVVQVFQRVQKALEVLGDLVVQDCFFHHFCYGHQNEQLKLELIFL